MKLFLSSLLFITSALFVTAHPINVSLDSIVSGAYKQAVTPIFYPMEKPDTYTTLDVSFKKINRIDYNTGRLLETILDLDKSKGTKLKTIKGFIFNSQETKVLLWCTEKPLYRRSWVTDYYIYDIKRNLIEPLSGQSNQRDAQFSPDGRSVAFVSNNNLFIKRLDYGSELTVTSDGVQNAVINGATDWVYEEEFAVTRAFTWSADSKYLAYLKFNETALTDYTMTLYGDKRLDSVPAVYFPGFKTFKYPSAGGINSTVSLYVYQLQARYSRPLTLPISADSYIPRICFTNKGEQLAVMTLNRAQNDFNIYLMNVKSGVPKLIYTDRNDTYVDPYYDAIQFTSHYFTCLSEQDGYRHLSVYDLNGVLKKQLTTGKWDVTRLIGLDTLNDLFYYQAARESPMKRSVWQVNLKGVSQKISTVDGVCTGLFNRDYSLFIQLASTLNTPQTVELYTIKGKRLRTMESNQVLMSKLTNGLSNQKTFFKVVQKNGVELNGWMLKPMDFDSLKQYPAILLQYSGPDAQKVLDQFQIGWEYYLAEKGFVVVTVDGRGTGGRGADFRRIPYLKLGQPEASDQIDVAHYLAKLPFVDKDRLGIWGWSYGGFETLMCMTDPDNPFKAGIAVAPVCDFRYYNTVYTERYMKTPAANKEGYDGSSPLLRASNLSGQLLLIHGLADDNVRANQSLDFMEALIEAGKQFDTQLYPISQHSILGNSYRQHLYNKMASFFINNLEK